MITLALTGDVMLGRQVNRALRIVSPEQPWGDVLPLLLSADLRIVNLECAITDHEQPWARTPKVFHFRADPSAVEVLRAARVDGCSLANNHTLDFEERGPAAAESKPRSRPSLPRGRRTDRAGWRCWPSQTTNRPSRLGRIVRERTIYRCPWSPMFYVG